MAGNVSRTELVQWVNDLLQLNYTKVEQCGTGAAYCQILDSIYLDVPMTRVKMTAKHEYESVANYKVMQNIFKSKKIDHPIPIDKLVKCKMQDNLEFLQWIKRFWEANYAGGQYDAVARRKGAPADPPASMAPVMRNTLAVNNGSTGRAGGRTPVGGRTGSAMSQNAQAQAQVVQGLKLQVSEMEGHMEGLEKERDFYFAKLRDIEVIVQGQMDTLEAEAKTDETLAAIQKILYSTEDGFEVPDGAPLDEEETF